MIGWIYMYICRFTRGLIPYKKGLDGKNLQRQRFMMETRSFLVLLLVLLILGSLDPVARSQEDETDSAKIFKFDSGNFPDGFIWGAATSAYQTEGAADKDGRKPSIWDIYAHNHSDRIADRSNGDNATEFYYHYKGDIQKMNEEIGLNAFRFSISWSRVIPTGNRSEGVNEAGIKFYDRVINECIKNGLEPFVTMFHWDLPQDLEREYRGFLSPRIISDFKDYAELLFQRFGDRVKHWITINEPYIFTISGYDAGDFPPSRCSHWVDHRCESGNSSTEPYIVAHHLLLAHATAVKAYRQLVQPVTGKIGITLDVNWAEPLYDTEIDRQASKTNLDFTYGWFLGPLTYGYYPAIMHKLVGDRLPSFSPSDSQLVKGSYDFIGINYYTANYVFPSVEPVHDPSHIRYATDSHVNVTKYKNGKPIGLQASPKWLFVYPDGIRYILNYTKDTYKDPIIYITENGVGDTIIPDKERISYYQQHLHNVLLSICDYRVRVKGFFAWSFIDNWEWVDGFTVKFGLYSVDKNMARHPKFSVHWFKNFLENKNSTGSKCPLKN